MKLSPEQSRLFATAFPIEEVKSYIAANQEEFLRWCEEEAQKHMQTQASPPPKHRLSRKGATK